MACFTDLDYRNKSYPLLQTIQAALATKGFIFTIVSYGCFDGMTDASKLYQFYSALNSVTESDPITENCFVQKTEDQQLFIFNNSLFTALQA